MRDFLRCLLPDPRSAFREVMAVDAELERKSIQARESAKKREHARASMTPFERFVDGYKIIKSCYEKIRALECYETLEGNERLEKIVGDYFERAKPFIDEDQDPDAVIAQAQRDKDINAFRSAQVNKLTMEGIASVDEVVTLRCVAQYISSNGLDTQGRRIELHKGVLRALTAA